MISSQAQELFQQFDLKYGELFQKLRNFSFIRFNEIESAINSIDLLIDNLDEIKNQIENIVYEKQKKLPSFYAQKIEADFKLLREALKNDFPSLPIYRLNDFMDLRVDILTNIMDNVYYYKDLVKDILDIERGDSIIFGEKWCEKNDRPDLINCTVKLTPQWFETDNGLFTSNVECPGLWDEEAKEADSIYHLFGNEFEDFMDCQLIKGSEEDKVEYQNIIQKQNDEIDKHLEQVSESIQREE